MPSLKTRTVIAASSQIPVAVWLRVSTDDQAHGDSPEHHEARARAYAESRGWSVVRVYNLSGVSGKSVWRHPECQAMLGDIRAGRIQAVIVSKLARLARNTRELLDFADAFNECDADLVSLGEAIDTSTPAGRLFFTIVAAMATWEREEIADRVKKSVPVRAKLGKQLGGQAPFGYAWRDGNLVVVDDEAAIRRLMHELFLEHGRFKTVARVLNERGHRARRGSRFSDSTVKRLLTDPIAKGMRRANYSESLGQRRHWKLKPESEWVWTDCPAIVSAEVWDETNRMIESQRSDRQPPKKAKRLFTGLAVCECGGKMYQVSSSPKYTCQACRRKVAASDLEEIVRSELESFSLDPERIEAAVAASSEVLAERQRILRGLLDESSKLESEVEKLYQLYLMDGISAKRYAERTEPLEERRDQLDREIPRLQGEIDAHSISLLSSEEVVAQSRGLVDSWPSLDEAAKRRIVTAIISEIRVGEDIVDFEFHFEPGGTPPPTSPGGDPSALVVSPPRRHKGQRIFTDALPIITVPVRARRPRHPVLDRQPRSLGEHLLRVRLERGLTQSEVAQELEVDIWTVLNWEHDRRTPAVQLWPKIYTFLGYDPEPPPETLSERLRRVRRRRGWPQRRLAAALKVDPTSVYRWESLGRTPRPDTLRRLESRLASLEDAFRSCPTPTR